MKVLACTSIRSDYDLLSPLYLLMKEHDDIDLKLIVSGAHLSKKHGLSIGQIKEDELDILVELETLVDEDDDVSRIRSASNLLAKIIDPVSRYSPDLIIFAGDREDVIIYALLGLFLDIPTAHFYSGDHASDGYVDNPVRHATSKLSTTHFVAHEEHRRRLLAMGESSSRIHNIGSISLDRFCSEEKESKEETLKRLKLNKDWLVSDYALVIFHPIKDEEMDSDVAFENILLSLKEKSIKAFVSFPNTDPNNNSIRDVIERYSQDDNFYFYKNLTRENFISIYKNTNFIIGNSSSGIYEAGAIPIPAINVGLRQRGRLCGDNVIFVSCDRGSIKSGIDKISSTKFSESLEGYINPYGIGNSALKALEIIKKNNFNSMLRKSEDPLDLKE